MRASIRATLLIFSFIAVVVTTMTFFAVSIHGEREAYNKRYSTFLVKMSKSETILLNTSFDSLIRRVEQVKTSPLINAAYTEYNSTPDSADKAGNLISVFFLALDDKLQPANNNLVNITLCEKNGTPILTCKQTEDTAIETFGYIHGSHTNNEFYYTPSGGLMYKTPFGDKSLVFTFSHEFVKRIFRLSMYTEKTSKGNVVIVDPAGICITSEDVTRNFSEPEFAALNVIDKSFQGSFDFHNTYDKFVGGVNSPANHPAWRVFVYSDVNEAGTYWNSASVVEYITVIVALLFCLFAVIFTVYYTAPVVRLAKIGTNKFHRHYFNHIDNTVFAEYGKSASVITALADDIAAEKDRFSAMAENTENIVFNWNLAEDNIQFKGGFNKKFSYRAHTDRFDDCFFVKCKVHPDDEERYYKDLDSLKHNELIQGEYRFKDSFGEYVWFIIRTVAIAGENEKTHNVLGVMIDIDRAKKNAGILSIRASFDALTELYNRESVYHIIGNEIELVSLRKSEIAIFFIDVDNFKYYNDNFSHATGNQVLSFIAQTLSDACDNGDIGFAGRFGGDEFIVCIKDSKTNDPETIIKKIMRRLKDGFVCDMGAKLTISVSVGIALVHDSSQTIEKIIEVSDTAMYEIKKNGKANYAFIHLES